MWIIRWIVLLLIIVVVLTFSLENQGSMVNIQMMNWHSGDIPLYLALFISFGFGMVSFLLIAVFQQLQTLADLGKERRLRMKLEKEHEESAEELERLKDEMELGDKEITRLRRENEVLREEADTARKEKKKRGGTAKKNDDEVESEGSETETSDEGSGEGDDKDA